MKLLEIISENISEGSLNQVPENLPKETEEIKEIIKNGNKVCVMYYKHLKTMNFEVVDRFMKNFERMIENLEETQKLYYKKWVHYYDILEIYEEQDYSYGVLREFSNLISSLDDIQSDMDTIRDIINDFVYMVKKNESHKLDAKYDIKKEKNNE